MKVTILQTDIAWADAEKNIDVADKLMAQASGADLYVLPEMWSTGFATEPQGIADTQGTALGWMRRKADELGAAICGSVAIAEPEGDAAATSYRNRLYFVKPGGSEPLWYDKHHLFSYGGEDRHYAAGTRRTVAEYGGMRFLLATCYDTRFPLWLRYRDDYDAIVIVANWPSNRQSAWQILTRARAIENQCYVIAANRVGNDPYSHYEGRSAVVDAYGKTLAQARANRQETITAVLDKARLDHFRQKFPVLRERDIIEQTKQTYRTEI